MNEHVTPAKSKSAQRSAAYRKRMREAGLRPVTLWLPDMRNPEIAAEYARQAATIAAIDAADDDLQAWLDAAFEWPEYEWPEQK